MPLKEMQAVQGKAENIGPFQLLLVGLSVYVLGALFIEAAVPISPSTRAVLLYVDNAICVVFLLDFVLRFAQADGKLRFLRWGWIDLVSSIPAVPILRIGRAVRVVRVLKLLRGFRSFKTIGGALFSHRAKGAIVTAAFLSTLLIVFSSITILHVENVPEANIHGPEDALWWSIVTITTVGYGDRYPVTLEGRVVAAMLMLCGVGFFAILSGAFAAWFMTEEEQGDDSEDAAEEIIALRHEIGALRAEIRESMSVAVPLEAREKSRLGEIDA